MPNWRNKFTLKNVKQDSLIILDRTKPEGSSGCITEDTRMYQRLNLRFKSKKHVDDVKKYFLQNCMSEKEVQRWKYEVEDVIPSSPSMMCRAFTVVLSYSPELGDNSD